jgi:hypothetical protein
VRNYFSIEALTVPVLLAIASLLAGFLTLAPAGYAWANGDFSPPTVHGESSGKAEDALSVTSDSFTARIESLHNSAADNTGNLSPSNVDNDILRVVQDSPPSAPLTVTDEPYAPHAPPKPRDAPPPPAAVDTLTTQNIEQVPLTDAEPTVKYPPSEEAIVTMQQPKETPAANYPPSEEAAAASSPQKDDDRPVAYFVEPVASPSQPATAQAPLPLVPPPAERPASETAPLTPTEPLPLTIDTAATGISPILNGPANEAENAELPPFVESVEPPAPVADPACVETAQTPGSASGTPQSTDNKPLPLTVTSDPYFRGVSQDRESPAAPAITATTEAHDAAKAAIATTGSGLDDSNVVVYFFDSGPPAPPEIAAQLDVAAPVRPSEAAIVKPSVEVFESALPAAATQNEPWMAQPPLTSRDSSMNRNSMYLEASNNYPGQPFGRYARHKAGKGGSDLEDCEK